MERATRFFEVALAMYDGRKAVLVVYPDGQEVRAEIEVLKSDGRVGLAGLLNYIDMMDIIRFEETTASPGG